MCRCFFAVAAAAACSLAYFVCAIAAAATTPLEIHRDAMLLHGFPLFYQQHRYTRAKIHTYTLTITTSNTLGTGSNLSTLNLCSMSFLSHHTIPAFSLSSYTLPHPSPFLAARSPSLSYRLLLCFLLITTGN